MTTSEFMKLDKMDLLKGVVVAVITPVLVAVQTSIEAGAIAFDLKHMGMAAVGGFCAYLLKNFFSGDKNKPEDTCQH